MADGGVSEDPRVRRQQRAGSAEKLAELLAAKKAEQEYASGGNVNNGAEDMDRDINLVVKGVTINWLAQAFHMDHRTVTQRLKDCPPLSRKRGKNGLLYDISVAAGYLVKPVFNVEEYIKSMRVEELPTRLQEGFWAAALKRQKWEENAGLLWRTDYVVKKFSETFLMVANDMKMWLDDMEASVEVTPEQRAVLEDQLKRLQKKISKTVRDMPRITRPQLAEMIGPTTTPAAPQPAEEDDNDIDADVLAVV